MAVITHVDVAEKDHVETLESVLRVCGVSDIFRVANLTDGKAKLEDLYQLSLLNLIERCMTDGDDTLIFKYYQKMEEKRRDEIQKKLARRRCVRKKTNDGHENLNKGHANRSGWRSNKNEEQKKIDASPKEVVLTWNMLRSYRNSSTYLKWNMSAKAGGCPGKRDG